MKKILTILMTLALAVPAFTASASDGGEESGSVNTKEIIFEHLGDAYGWEAPFCHSTRIPLPIIVRDYQGGWHLFSSARVQHGETCEGFYIAAGGDHNGKVVGQKPDGAGAMVEYRPLDISITKNVAALIICAIVVILCTFSVVRWYKRHGNKAPRRWTACMEMLVEFVYMGVIRPTLGKKAHKFAPYLLTVFFFILTMNLLGLIVIFPGGANLTGNLAVTMVLALFTFFITNIFGSKHYWKDIFWPDVPVWLKIPPIMPIIEVFGMFTKPAALMVRLFANMMGGHMIVIVLTLLIFIFAGMFGIVAGAGTTVVSVAFSLFMLVLDTLVSFIQAYVFTMLSTLFISLAQAPEHAHE